MANNGSTAIIRPLGPLAQLITTVFRQPKDTITGVSQADPFGPLQPFEPIFPPDSRPRPYMYAPAQNQMYTPRMDLPLSAVQLRQASMFPLARVLIENVKDMLSRQKFNIRLRRRPGEPAKEYSARKPDVGIVQAIFDLMERPNSAQNRAEFTRWIAEDMLTIDAASVFMMRDRRGEIQELRPIDGATITRYIDTDGWTPKPPNVAYAQVWSPGAWFGPQGGIPSVNMTTDQLLYAARNILPFRLYGTSPTEQAYEWITVGANRLAFQGDYYTAGTVPDAFMIVPPGLGPDKIEEAQQIMNAQLANLARRREIRLIQGFRDQKDQGEDKLIQTKEAALTDPMDEMWVNYLCFAYGVSRQRLAKMLNRATGKANQEASEKEGLEPFVNWLQDSIWNVIIQTKMGPKFALYEVVAAEDTDVDPEKEATVISTYVKEGIIARNEAREKLGEEPATDPEADMLMVDTATGPVPLNVDKQIEQSKKKQEAMPDVDQAGNQPPQEKPGRSSVGPQNGSARGEKVRKSAGGPGEVKIDPNILAPESHQAKLGLADSIAKVFRRQKDKASDKAQHLLKSIRKSDDSEKTADEIYASLAPDFADIPATARHALETAILAGIAKGLTETGTASAATISAANKTASAWASDRAAELVGMTYDVDGNLVENPNAKWAISDTTRDRLRETVKAAFEAETPKAELVKRITELDAFSESRAEMIARTEIARAQTAGNYDAWQKSGLIKSVKWLLSDDHEMPDPCDDNAGKIVKIGEAFPTGVIFPPDHPNCMCSIVAAIIQE